MNELKRFIAKVDRRGDNECWNWTATKDGHGYGQFYYMGRNMKAPRVAWIMKNGPIPKGLLVCHKCDNPSCVNPNHLFLGTMSDNIMDCVRKGRHPHPVGKGNNTHCPQGHPYSGDNLYVSPRGERRCLICQNNHYQKRKLKDKKALLASAQSSAQGEEAAYNHAEVFHRRLVAAQEAILDFPVVVTELVRGYGIDVNEKQIDTWLRDALNRKAEARAALERKETK